MKIFAFTDIHGNGKLWKQVVAGRIQKEKPDIIICSGDFTIFEKNIRWWLDEFESTGIRFLLIHGNHESAGNIRKLCEDRKNIVFIHKQIYAFNSCLFMGYGGGGFAVTDNEFRKISREFKEEMKNYSKTILITHPPPFGTSLDSIEEKHSGSKSYRDFVEEAQPDLMICGHFHENFRKEDNVGKTRIINPGPEGITIKL